MVVVVVVVVIFVAILRYCDIEKISGCRTDT